MSPAAGTAFYCVSDERFFLGAVGLINSLRLVGHMEPIYLLDLGLTAAQRELLEPHVELVEAPDGVQPWLAKTVAPLAHPAEVMVLIDADMIATRPLDELIAQAAGGRVVAVEHGSQRFVAEWGEVLDLGPVEPRTYVCSGLLVAGRDPGIQVLQTMDDRQRQVDFDRGYLARDIADYPLLYLDQDVLNAVLASSVARGRVNTLARRMEAIPPFAGLRVLDERTLRCAYEDGVEPYLLHHFSAKPWLKATPEGIYTQLLRRLLLGPDLAIRVPERDLPVHLRTGLVGDAVRSWVSRRNLFGKQRAWQT
jgi:hypothetical protein